MATIPKSLNKRHCIQIETGSFVLEADVNIPANACGTVLIAHGSDSSRHSARNQLVAEQLHAGDLATLLLDLVVDGEQNIAAEVVELRFDVGLLGQRIVAAIDWLAQEPIIRDLPLGCFGAGTGAAAALIAAAARPARNGGVVT
jgi:putative phosphoribosyl transferase